MKKGFNSCTIVSITIILAGLISCGNLSNSPETETGLAIPTGLTATESQADCVQVQLTWKKVEDAIGYEVFLSESNDVSTSALPEDILSKTSTYIDLRSPGTYYFHVRAYKTGNRGNRIYSDYSSVEYTYNKPEPNSPPKYVSAVQSDEYGNKVKLTWQKNGHSSYYIYYHTENNPDAATKYKRYASFSGEMLIHLSNPGTYYFWVKAGTQTGEFSQVATCNFTPSPITVPQDLSAKQESGKNTINVTWKDSGAYSYSIYYNTEDNKGTAKEKSFIYDNFYSFDFKESGTYYFWVAAEDENGDEIGHSQGINCSFSVIKPQAPTNLSVEVIGNRVLISHTKKEGFYYNYYYSDKNDAKNATKKIGDFYFSKYGTYYFWVTAVDSAGVESDFSYPATCWISVY